MLLKELPAYVTNAFRFWLTHQGKAVDPSLPDVFERAVLEETVPQPLKAPLDTGPCDGLSIGSIFFDTGEDVAKDGSAITFAEITMRLQRRRVEPNRVCVVGFTDDTGEDLQNVGLSIRRAEYVAERLQQKLNPNNFRLHRKGFGKLPTDDTADPNASRRRNRRAEVRCANRCGFTDEAASPVSAREQSRDIL